eukprot:TRINITY_DN1957_c0_g1_i13.p1 TRINITY_DN1957_c0_g1~~TRINITY_DN1957_c0_g1_i13.p1  ORF type:complete len:692 (-),score=129.50 TRINITY_DN1957_c0_g1_i13:366-2441(-)
MLADTNPHLRGSLAADVPWVSRGFAGSRFRGPPPPALEAQHSEARPAAAAAVGEEHPAWQREWRANVFNRGEKDMQTRDGGRERAQQLGEHKVATEVHPSSVHFLQTRHALYVGHVVLAGPPSNNDVAEAWLTPIFADPNPCAAGGIPAHHVAGFALTTRPAAAEAVCLAEAKVPPLHTGDVAAARGRFCDSCGITSDAARLCSVFQAGAYKPLVRLESTSFIRVLKGPPESDPMWKSCTTPGAPVSLTFLEFETRKRYRVSGVICDPLTEGGFSVTTMECFSICPRYIQQRTIDFVCPAEEMPKPVAHSSLQQQDPSRLPEDLIEFITSRDTMFITSVNPELARGVDSSHRGGRPGFVRVVDKSKLVWGDYHGKGMFQVLGNTLICDKVGVTFVDFEHGHTLQVTGTLRVVWVDPKDGLDHCPRVCIFSISRWLYTEFASAFHWKFLALSSHHPVLIDTPLLHSLASSSVDSAADHWRAVGEAPLVKFHIETAWSESPCMKTFRLRMERPLMWEPGQYGTFCFDVGGAPFLRCFSVSSATRAVVPGAGSCDNLLGASDCVEISVKLQGRVTSWLHEHWEGSDGVCHGVEGGFTLSMSAYVMAQGNSIVEHPFSSWWKLLFLSAGSGVTPMMSMLRGIRNSLSGSLSIQVRHTKKMQPVMMQKTRRCPTSSTYTWSVAPTTCHSRLNGRRS